MEEELKHGILIVSSILLFIFMLIIAGVGGNYIHRKMEVENFQITIEDLSDEQKCMHICGFQYHGSIYFDQYKFCIEKCDRISERQSKCN